MLTKGFKTWGHFLYKNDIKVVSVYFVVFLVIRTNIFCRLSTVWLTTLTPLISRISSLTWRVPEIDDTNHILYVL